MTVPTDREAPAEALRQLPIRPSYDLAWTRPQSLQVIDCVLSLNRNYKRFVVPRLDGFEQRHPEVRSVRQLQQLIKRYPSPFEFVKGELDYDHKERADTLAGVVDWLSTLIGASNERESLRSWAIDARPSAYLDVGMRGFGLAAFQYLRMLFGANTTKPDRHVCKWVSDNVGRKVSPIEGLRLLEEAAAATGICLRDADTTIWEKSAT